MKVATAKQMRDIDRVTIEEMGIPDHVLMAFAGRAVADYIQKLTHPGQRTAVFAGTGNNGGDGFAAAYFLYNTGAKVDVYVAGDPGKISAASRIYHALCVNSGIRVSQITSSVDIAAIDLEQYDLIVDAMLGTGFAGKPRGSIAEIIQLINDSDAQVVSIDIPSGLDSDGAAPQGDAVMADYTVAIGLPKISLVTYPGKQYAGAVHVADIGFPKALTESDSLTADLMDDDFIVKNGINEIESEYGAAFDTHKAEKGHLLLLGGFDGMEGAIMMTARAALETGVGLVTLLTTSSSRAAIAGLIPELITAELPGSSAASSANELKKALTALFESRKYGALVLGPGMGRSSFSKLIFETIIENISELGIKRVLIDGDSLFHLAAFLERGSLDKAVEFVITPHFMEASRVSGIGVEEIRKNRFAAAAGLAAKLSCVAVLKGPATITSDGERHCINTTGSPALATAGSGDVLSGIIGSLLLRKFSCLHAAAYGAYIHGRAADLYCAHNHSNTLKATDLIPYIRAAKSRSHEK